MLCGLKAALSAGRRAPVLPLSGADAARTSGAVLSSPGSSHHVGSGITYDEERPAEELRKSAIGDPKSPSRFGELSGGFVDVEAGARLSTASTGVPSTFAGCASPPTTAGTFTPESSNYGSGSETVGGESRLGLTQLVISLDLDILGPTGLLAQLGLPAQHELETGLLRVQCNGLEVHHRATAPMASRDLCAHHQVADALGSSPPPLPATPSPPVCLRGGGGDGGDAFVTQARQLVGQATTTTPAPQQFYIGDRSPTAEKRGTSSGRNLLPDDFAGLFSHAESKTDKPIADGLTSSDSNDSEPGRSHTRTSKHVRYSGRQRVASLPALPGGGSSSSSTRLRGSSIDAQRTSSASKTARAQAQAQAQAQTQAQQAQQAAVEPTASPGLKQAAGTSNICSPSAKRALRGQRHELHELEILRKKNLRLERDLYESLRALEEDSISSSASSSPMTSPLPREASTRKLEEMCLDETSPSRLASSSRRLGRPNIEVGVVQKQALASCRGDFPIAGDGADRFHRDGGRRHDGIDCALPMKPGRPNG